MSEAKKDADRLTPERRSLIETRATKHGGDVADDTVVLLAEIDRLQAALAAAENERPVRHFNTRAVKAKSVVGSMETRTDRHMYFNDQLRKRLRKPSGDDA